MNPEVEIRITVREGMATVGAAGMAQITGAPQPDPQMGGAAMGAAGMAAPSPMEGTAGGMQAAAPSPMTAGAVAMAGAALPTPVPLDQTEQLGMGGDTSAAPSPEGAG